MARKGKPDLYLWEWLQLMLVTYGADGMSSDDTVFDGNTKNRMFKMQSMPWHQDIDNELSILEEMSMHIGLLQRPGRAKADRMRLALNNCLPTTRAVQKNLPQVYYRKEFLRNLNELEMFNIALDKTAEHSQWYNLVLQD
jgi:hypothetical protein